MIHALTIDVEDYWCIFYRDWLYKEAGPSNAVIKNTEWFLQILDEHNIKATFFVLGEVAKKFPSLIKEIAENGHEIGSHGLSHKQIFKLSEEQFCQEVSGSKNLLEDITGEPIIGYRAPAFSVMPQTQWALEVLAGKGFKYDSSVYPISGNRYGWPGFSKDICRVDLPSGRSIIEVPMSTVSILGKPLPVAGGGYIRHFPYAVTKYAIKRIQKNRPAIVYMHPYEIDIDKLSFDMNHLSDEQKSKALKFHRLQMRSRNTVKNKVRHLLTDFKFTTIKALVEK
ncbi:MAG: hypothetical protein A2173_12030 [Planctomycetes bacterium RBG_13_44_8b]|nr:MAG: hypothetical protein A2173_12030 [Planctomycetes bacterium RBG_13_44_8b]